MAGLFKVRPQQYWWKKKGGKEGSEMRIIGLCLLFLKSSQDEINLIDHQQMSE